jgi:hypothetical protein
MPFGPSRLRTGNRPLVPVLSESFSVRSLILGLMLLVCLSPTPATAAVGLPASWDKGFTFTSWWKDHYASATAAKSFDQMRAANPNSVAILTTWYTSDLKGSTIAPRADHTPSDAALRKIIRRAQKAGLKTFLRPIVDPYSGGWRAEYNPDDPNAWFASYRAFMNHYADLADELGVDTFAIGAELTSMTVPAYSSTWRSIIAGIRQRYSGKLTYGSVYGDHVDFWDALDYFGIDWYMSLAAASAIGQPTLSPADRNLGVDAIADRWSNFTDEYGITHHYLWWLEDQYRRWGKKIVFNELGYPSNQEALVNPFSSYSPTGTVDTNMQARAYCGAFQALATRPWVKGIYIWQWYWKDRSIHPATDTDQSPQNKPAEDVIRTWFEPRRAAQGSSRCTATRRRQTATSLRLRRSAGAKHRVRATGRVRGASGGSVVVFASRRQAGSGRWVTAKRAIASVADDGSFAVTMRLAKGTAWSIRAEFRGTRKAAPSRSSLRRLRR